MEFELSFEPVICNKEYQPFQLGSEITRYVEGKFPNLEETEMEIQHPKGHICKLKIC